MTTTKRRRGRPPLKPLPKEIVDSYANLSLKEFAERHGWTKSQAQYRLMISGHKPKQRGREPTFPNGLPESVLNELLNDSTTCLDLAKRYGVSPSLINHLARAAGLSLVSEQQKKVLRKHKERRDRIIQEYLSGSSLRETGKKFKISDTRVGQILHQANVKGLSGMRIVPCQDCGKELACNRPPAVCPDCLKLK